VSENEKERLDALAAHLLPKGPPPRLYFFAREGFDAALVREAHRSDRVHLVAAADLFDGRYQCPRRSIQQEAL
jgi:hypothetical protein